MSIWIIEVIPFGIGKSYTFLGSKRFEAGWLKHQLKKAEIRHKVNITRGWEGELGVGET